MKNKQNRRALNERALEILAKNDDFSIRNDPQMLERVKEYSGKGGVEGDLNQYYTAPKMVETILEILPQLDYNQALVLEPSCATGRFMENAPRKWLFHGIEIDPVASRISRILYGDKAVIENLDFRRFAMLQLQNGEQPEVYDVVIGNPPFGTFTVNRQDMEATNYGRDMTHNRFECFFVEECLKMLKPGGILAMVLPQSCLSGESLTGWRKRLTGMGGTFLGAMRFPQDTHDDTVVVTDAWFLMKSPRIQVSDSQSTFQMGNWFLCEENRPFILGTESTRQRFGEDVYTVLGPIPEDLDQIINRFVTALRSQVRYFRLRPSKLANQVEIGGRTANIVQGQWKISSVAICDDLPNLDIADLLQMDFPTLLSVATGTKK